MVTITGNYLGNKKMILKHEPSGTQLSTSAPKDNQGDGSSFSPTDLVATALGSCAVTTMAIVAERDGIDITGTHFVVEKHMSANPRRVGRLPLTIHMPSRLTADQRQKLENTARTCPVNRSLHPEIPEEMIFTYDL